MPKCNEQQQNVLRLYFETSPDSFTVKAEGAMKLLYVNWVRYHTNASYREGILALQVPLQSRRRNNDVVHVFVDVLFSTRVKPVIEPAKERPQFHYPGITSEGFQIVPMTEVRIGDVPKQEVALDHLHKVKTKSIPGACQ